MKPQFRITPAAPGWKVIFPVSEKGKGCTSLFYEDVVSWLHSIEDTGHSLKHEPLLLITPITVEGAEYNCEVMQRPNGSFTAPSDRDFENEEEVISYFSAKIGGTEK